MKQKSIAVDLWVYLFNYLFNYLFMKLIITNRKEFESYFDDPNYESFSSKEIHKFIFQQLQQNLVVNNSIPLIIFQEVNLDGWKDAEFRLQGFKEGYCFYQFYGIVS